MGENEISGVRAARGMAAPAAGDVEHPPADDTRADRPHGLVEDVAVDLGRGEPSAFVVVAPRPAHDPVVQALAALAEAAAGTVVRPRDETIKRHGDVGDDLAHGLLLSRAGLFPMWDCGSGRNSSLDRGACPTGLT